MAGHQKEKAIADEVHQNQILRELYLKELRTQKLYTQYHVNPLRKGEGRYRTEGGKEGRSRQVCGAGGALCVQPTGTGGEDRDGHPGRLVRSPLETMCVRPLLAEGKRCRPACSGALGREGGFLLSIT